MKRNDERKNEIYRFVNEYISENGRSPSTDELCRHFGVGKATVSKFISRLCEEGLLERRTRYTLSSRESVSGAIKMPIVGSIACGKPTLALEDIKGYITASREELGGGEYFALLCEGDSMTGAGIDDGDLVYVRRQQAADEGNIVVAMVEDRETGEYRATLKRLYLDREGKSYILHAENPAYSDIVVPKIEVVGVAVRVLKNLE